MFYSLPLLLKWVFMVENELLKIEVIRGASKRYEAVPVEGRIATAAPALRRVAVSTHQELRMQVLGHAQSCWPAKQA